LSPGRSTPVSAARPRARSRPPGAPSPDRAPDRAIDAPRQHRRPSPVLGVDPAARASLARIVSRSRRTALVARRSAPPDCRSVLASSGTVLSPCYQRRSRSRSFLRGLDRLDQHGLPFVAQAARVSRFAPWLSLQHRPTERAVPRVAVKPAPLERLVGARLVLGRRRSQDVRSLRARLAVLDAVDFDERLHARTTVLQVAHAQADWMAQAASPIQSSGSRSTRAMSAQTTVIIVVVFRPLWNVGNSMSMPPTCGTPRSG